MSDGIVSTSVARGLIARMEATHQRRRISVFSGPPGIGKTTALDHWRRQRPNEIAVVKVGWSNARELLVLQHMLEALKRLTGSIYVHAPYSIWQVKRDLFNTMCGWGGLEPAQARKGEYGPDDFRHLTLVFDEAQNLSRQAIDALRYWNDPDRCYGPFPVGLIFIGNNEFSLAGNDGGPSVISAAVADRALYIQTLTYDDLSDDDLAMFLTTHGVTDRGAVLAILRAFRGPRSARSLRRLLDILEDIKDVANGGPITAEVVGSVLSLV